ncbi:Prenyltransferase/squalene oxidase [Paenibacillus curdlanolyticus YK9]|uniref:Prenyltransferase/squalene oxidase n=1 Tax=Paenibacillus curdlanolyticus YK9 TaxID=717606 RepID=E0I6P7_9BACL|nr:prenyltransferase/squalene oxidase repeat-containing protein [Paenibacillus curdlanolyticus]EFM11713.1 Prenyltransferase/squalene oxidase [Paenibacillus curdlanolyticus YK9]
MIDWTTLRHRIDTMANQLLADQSPDGAWRMCIDCGTMSDCYYLTALRLLDVRDDPLVRSLAARIVSRRSPDGVWRLFPDEREGSLDATAEAVLALLLSGVYTDRDPIIVSAKRFIREQGGLAKVRSFLTQALLCAAGIALWPRSLQIPLSAFFNKSGPLPRLFELSGHARVHLIPILIMANKRYALRTAYTPDLSDLFLGAPPRFDNDSPVIAALNNLIGAFSGLLTGGNDSLYEPAVTFLLERIEPDGTLLTYSTATVLMLFALNAVGRLPTDPILISAINGIRTLLCGNPPMVQIATPTVWDTAMLAFALREAGISPSHSALRRAARFIQERQQTRYGDWRIRNPGTSPGGWGFSYVNTRYPDCDCTTAALRVIQRSHGSPTQGHAAAAEPWERGLNWLLSMRNDDGGWPAFERNGKPLPAGLFGFNGASEILTDLSTPDLTGRTLQMLGETLGMSTQQRWLSSSARWMLSQQQKDGSWYGRWGITYTHGTGAAVLGLTAIGLTPDHPAIARAVKWLLSIQRPDGGWGESCYSDQRRHYVPLNFSTPSQTAWALDALAASLPALTPELERGVNALLHMLETPAQQLTRYPTGAGLAGTVYVHYESNNWIWPLLTLTRIERKFRRQRG